MKTTFVFLVVLLLLVGCRSYTEEKVDARRLADGGEWNVKETDNDPIPPVRNSDGSVTTSTGIHACSADCLDSDSMDGLDIRFSKTSEGQTIVFCVQKSHPQYAEFSRLKRGDKVAFDYTDTPMQEKCLDGAMFVRLRATPRIN